ncbi:hypothetical protein AA313_de0202986 [Arthrobotrys entomopaga]|nr:hypothetical protein AA313_de0202986 [Arthrobotrys entomopaga]
MRFTSYIAVAAAVFAVQVSSLPTGSRPNISKRDIPAPPPVPGPPTPGSIASMSTRINDMIKNLQSMAKALSLPKGSGLTARSLEPESEPDVEAEVDESDAEDSGVVEDPTPVAGSQFNKKSPTAEPQEEEEQLDDGEALEPEMVIKRTVNSGQVPGAGITQDLPSGIVMWIIILMVYAMFTTISMKGE